MFLPTTSRRPSTRRMVISTCYCIPRLRLILASSGRVFISSSVLFLSVGRPLRLFINKFGLAVSGAARSIGFPVPQYTDNQHVGQLSSLPFGWLRIHHSSEPWQQLTSCVTCSLRRVILLVSTSRSPPLRLACVFWVSYVTRCVKLSSFPKIKETSLRR